MIRNNRRWDFYSQFPNIVKQRQIDPQYQVVQQVTGFFTQAVKYIYIPHAFGTIISNDFKNIYETTVFDE